MPSLPSSPHFFKELESFSEFSEIVQDEHYSPLPPGWSVVIADVKDSLKAIENGHYRDVNTIGAAAIATVQNILGEMEIPYVFGGDGATLLIPNPCREAVALGLAYLKNLSRKKFNLDLRVGIVDATEIFANGHAIDVAKLELSSGKCIGIFRGGGLTHAEHLVKGFSDKYEIADAGSGGVDLGGLSCRWNAIPNKHGCILSLLVAATGKDEKKIYRDLFGKIQETVGVGAGNPVNTEAMTYRPVAESAKNEKRFHSKWSFRWIGRFLEIIGAVLIFKWRIPPLFFNPSRYADSMRTHSDYRKFDDMLRMVVDCTPDQFRVLGDYLERAHGRGDVIYGIHRSDTALMTCYFQSTRDGDHIHFIDGGDGGYALAAKQLKAQRDTSVPVSNVEN